MKTCRKCGKVKPSDQFHKGRNECKSCSAAYGRAHYRQKYPGKKVKGGRYVRHRQEVYEFLEYLRGTSVNEIWSLRYIRDKAEEIVPALHASVPPVHFGSMVSDYIIEKGGHKLSDKPIGRPLKYFWPLPHQRQTTSRGRSAEEVTG